MSGNTEQGGSGRLHESELEEVTLEESNRGSVFSSSTSAGSSMRDLVFDQRQYHRYASEVLLRVEESEKVNNEGRRFTEQLQKFQDIDQTQNLMDSANYNQDASIAPGSRPSSMNPTGSTSGEAAAPRKTRESDSTKKNFFSGFSSKELEEILIGDSLRNKGVPKNSDGAKALSKTSGGKSSYLLMILRFLAWSVLLVLVVVSTTLLLDFYIREETPVLQEDRVRKNVRIDPHTPRFYEIKDFVLSKGLSSHDDLNDSHSIQSSAVRWLSNIDSLEYQEDDRLLHHRYVLAVLAYATHSDIAVAHSRGDISELYANSSDFTFQSWMTQENHCNWEGIRCSNGHVEDINMTKGNFHGFIPSELVNIRLKSIDLSYNQLQGSIPILNEDLYSLVLNNNLLHGRLPALNDYSRLKTLNLSSNKLGGTIPANLRHLKALTTFDLRYNRLTGTIPKDIGMLSSLEYLGLTWNRLTGTIPPEMGNLEKLEILRVNKNRLTGSLPQELKNLRSLEEMHFHQNALSGSVPSEVCSLRDGHLALVMVDCEFVTCDCCECH